jgi:hypothetical protein
LLDSAGVSHGFAEIGDLVAGALDASWTVGTCLAYWEGLAVLKRGDVLELLFFGDGWAENVCDKLIRKGDTWVAWDIFLWGWEGGIFLNLFFNFFEDI